MNTQLTGKDFFFQYPALVSLSFVYSFPDKPLISVLENPQSRVVCKKESKERWRTEIKEIYHPLLKFLLEQEISFGAILSGHFLDFVAEESPKTLTVLQKLSEKGLMHIVADAYWGTSYLSMYYLDWWIDEIIGTTKRVEKYLETSVDTCFLPLVYRSLPLEKLTTKTGIKRIISVKNQRKISYHQTELSDFRRYHGNKVDWISDEDDCQLEFYFYSRKNYFGLMDARLSQDPKAMTKTRSMDIGLRSSRVQTELRTPIISTSVRIPEERPTAGFHPLEQATFRLWEYATYMLGKEHAEVDTIDDDPLMRNLFYVMHRDFLVYLKPNQYSKKRDMPFSSPYEAFVHVQNTVFQLELLLKKTDK